jgi:hypothetical protein
LNPFHFYFHENLTDQLVFKAGRSTWNAKQGDKVNNLKQGDTEENKMQSREILKNWMLWKPRSIMIFAIAMSAKKRFFNYFFSSKLWSWISRSF